MALPNARQMRPVQRQISGWGRYPRSQARLYRPEKIATLGRLIAAPPEDSLLARGLGRSYGDAALNSKGGTVLSSRLDRLLEFDQESGVLRAEAGVSFAEILRLFVPRGFFLPVTPGTQQVSLGGAIASDVHGKNHHLDGPLSRHLLSIELLDGQGRELSLSPERDAQAFHATAGGMGLTGFITSAAIRLRRIETAFISAERTRSRDLDETMRLLEEFDGRWRYTVAWLDTLAKGGSLGRGVVMGGEHARLDQLDSRRRGRPLDLPARSTLSVPFDAPGLLLNPFSIRLFNQLYYRRAPARIQGELVDLRSFFHPLDALRDWNRLYGRRGFLQYQFVLPPCQSRPGLIEVLERFSQAGIPSFLSVLKRFGEEAGPLSFPCPGYTLTLDIPARLRSLEQFLDSIDRIIVRRGGRVYLAKDARLKPDAAEAMYPRLAQWLQVKQRLDPQGLFASDLSRRLGFGGSRR